MCKSLCMSFASGYTFFFIEFSILNIFTFSLICGHIVSADGRNLDWLDTWLFSLLLLKLVNITWHMLFHRWHQKFISKSVSVPPRQAQASFDVKLQLFLPLTTHTDLLHTYICKWNSHAGASYNNCLANIGHWKEIIVRRDWIRIANLDMSWNHQTKNGFDEYLLKSIYFLNCIESYNLCDTVSNEKWNRIDNGIAWNSMRL